MKLGFLFNLRSNSASRNPWWVCAFLAVLWFGEPLCGAGGPAAPSSSRVSEALSYVLRQSQTSSNDCAPAIALPGVKPLVLVTSVYSAGLPMTAYLSLFGAAVVALQPESKIQELTENLSRLPHVNVTNIVPLRNDFEGLSHEARVDEIRTQLKQRYRQFDAVAIGGEAGVFAGDIAANIYGVPGSVATPELVLGRRHKPTFNEILKRNGLSYIQEKEVQTAEQAVDFVRDHLFPADYRGGGSWPEGFSVVVKPPLGVGMTDTEEATSFAEVAESVTKLLSHDNRGGTRNRSALIQESLKGYETAVNMLTHRLPNGVVLCRWFSSYSYGRTKNGRSNVYNHDKLMDPRNHAMLHQAARFVARVAHVTGAHNSVMHGELFAKKTKLANGQDTWEFKMFDPNYRLGGGENWRMDKVCTGTSGPELLAELRVYGDRAPTFFTPFLNPSKYFTEVMPDGTPWLIAPYDFLYAGMIKNLKTPGGVRLREPHEYQPTLRKIESLTFAEELQRKAGILDLVPRKDPSNLFFPYYSTKVSLPMTESLSTSPGEFLLVNVSDSALVTDGHYIDQLDAAGNVLYTK